jgi:hypothetical protein
MSDSAKTFERQFLLDYLWFGRMVLPHQARVILAEYESETDADLRRLHFVAIHTVLLEELEHVAAWILALRGRVTFGTPPLERLMLYSPGEAKLTNALDRLTDGHQLLAACGIEIARFVPRFIPSEELESRVQTVWDRLSVSAAEQIKRLPLYNKSKHGMVFASSPSAIAASQRTDGPMAVYARKQGSSCTMSCIGITEGAGQARVMARQTLGLANVLGELLHFYALQEHEGIEAEILRIRDMKRPVVGLRID